MATLTPEIAKNLMHRSMTTGAPTSEFDRYGGYGAVAAMYTNSGGNYGLDEIDRDTLNSYANTVANTGVGNLAALTLAGVPLSAAGTAAMRQNGIDEAMIAQFSQPSSSSAASALTPEIARNLMQRSMTTGVPTSEFDRYGGYDAVQSLYNSNNGTYSLEDLDADFLDLVADQIANSGVGNLTVLGMTDTPLTEAGLQAMNKNGVNISEDFLKERGIPYEGFLPKINSPILSGGSSSGGLGTSAGINTGNNAAAGANYLPTAFSGNSGERLGAGSANYQSDLIRSLREADNGLMSQNTGFTKYGYTPPPTSGGGGVSLNAGGAFNPGVLNQDVASADDVANWNNYSTYRTNSLNAKTPITSFEEWLSGGKSSGLPPPAPVEDPSIAWLAQQGGGA